MRGALNTHRAEGVQGDVTFQIIISFEIIEGGEACTCDLPASGTGIADSTGVGLRACGNASGEEGRGAVDGTTKGRIGGDSVRGSVDGDIQVALLG